MTSGNRKRYAEGANALCLGEGLAMEAEEIDDDFNQQLEILPCLNNHGPFVSLSVQFAQRLISFVYVILFD